MSRACPLHSSGPRLTGALTFSILVHGLLLAIFWWKLPMAGQRLPTIIEVSLEFTQPAPGPATQAPPAVSPPRPKPAVVQPSSPVKQVAIKPKPVIRKQSKPIKKVAVPVQQPPAVAVEQPVTEPTEPVPQATSSEVLPNLPSAPTAAGPASPSKGTTTSANDGLFTLQAAYISDLRQQISRYKKYPLMARRTEQQGVVVLDFVLNTDGSLADCSIARSSGHPLLDRAARKAVVNAAPFAPLPGGLDHQPLKCQLPLRFELSR